MRQKLLLLFLLFSIFCSAQENCENSIDDDGDGKIDLNDSDCVCNNAVPKSLLTNHSFEERIRCPYNYYDLTTMNGWIKGTIPSPAYLNKDCYLFETIYSKNLQDFPDGKGIVGAVYKNNKKEYIASKLSTALLTGKSYQLILNIASINNILSSNLSKHFDFNFLEPTYVTLYGCNNKDNLPLYTTSDPNSFDSTWIEIGKILYQPQASWGEITLNFTPNIDINAIMLGPEKVLPPSFNTDNEPTFLYDNLRLNTAENFGVTIIQTGNFCNNDLILTADFTKTMSLGTTIQWYKSGIAIVGATDKSYSIPSVKANLGEYSVKVKNGNECYISSKLTINNSIPNPSLTVVQASCQDINGYITVNEPGMEYSFEKGLPLDSDDYYDKKDLVWQTEANFTTKEYGKYYIQARTTSGCISTPTIITLSPPIVLEKAAFSIIQPTCSSGGTITITTVASEFSFDNGQTWQNSATKTNLPAGNYFLKIKNSSGCESYPQSVFLFQYFIDSPTFNLTQPTCNEGGSITVTSPASEYSFDNGVTWTTNPIATNLPSGYYNIRIKNEFGCESKPTYYQIYFNDFAKPYPDVKVTQPSTCSNTGIIYFLKRSSKYSIDNGQTWQLTQTFTNLKPGNYLLKTQNELGCESLATQVKVNFNLPKPTFTITNPSCTTSGSITVNTTTSFYSFDNGDTWTTNPTASNLASGYYNIRIKNEIGCESDVQYAYLPPFYLDKPKFEIINPNCTTTSKWSISITTPAAAYSFDGGMTWSPNATITNLDYGTYFLKIKNELGCESNYAFTDISNDFYLESPKFVAIQPTCTTPGRVTIITPAAFYSFDDGATWSTDPNLLKYPNGGVSGALRIKNEAGCISNQNWFNLVPNYLDSPSYTIVKPTTCDNNATGSITITTAAAFYSFNGGLSWSTNPIASNLPVGFKYQLRIKNAVGCESGDNIVELEPVKITEAKFIVTYPSCGKGGTITITTPAPFYSFDGGETWGINPKATNLPNGFYYPKIKNEAGCISQTFNSVIFNEEYLTGFDINATQPTCESGNKGSIIVDPFFDQYSFDGGRSWSQYNTATNLLPGNYSIIVKNNLGCESWWRTATIFPFYLPKPTYTIVNPICGTGGSISITSPAAQYSFDNGDTWSTNATAQNLEPGNYVVIIKNELGCEAYPLSVYVPNFFLSEPLYSITQPNCESLGTIIITTDASEYSIDNGITWSSNATFNNLQPGYYNLKIKNNLGCESNYKSVHLYNINLPAEKPTISVQQPSSCNSSKGKITVTTIANQYSFDNGLTWTSNPIATDLTTGDYFIRIKNGPTGCPSPSTKATIEIPLDAIQIPTYTTSEPISCTNPFGSITITSAAYGYSFDNGLSWTTNANATVLLSGLYNIKIKNSAGCESESVPVQINTPTDFPSLPTYSISQPNCNNSKGTITINTVASAYSFDNGISWSTSNISTFLNPGEYFLKTKTVNGCISNANKATIISFINSIPKPISNTPQTFCIQENATINDISISGQNVKWYDTLTNGTPLSNATPLQNGTNYYASQTINGCESERIPVIINIQNTLAPTGSTNQTFCYNQNPTLNTIQISGTSIKWYNSSGTLLSNSTYLQNGVTYYATQTENSCESERIGITISIVNTPATPTANTNQTFCKKENASLSTIQIAGQDIKWYETNFSTISLPNSTLLENNKSYYASQAIGCESSRIAILIRIYDTPPPTGSTNQQFCIDENAQISNLNTLGSNIKWYDALSNGTTLAETTALSNGVTYYATQTLNDCESERIAITVTIQDTQNPIVNPKQTFCIQENAKISTIAIEGQNIKWYASLSSLTTLSELIILENGMTYYASQTINNCENERTPITVNILEATNAGCLDLVDELPYPKFFTPNGDGFNDTWTINFAYLKPNSVIKIFDRYGKLITVLNQNKTWNGTYNNQQLPATDYWFVVTREDGKEYKGHFSLKR